MEDCVFCKIVASQLPRYQVYEDDLFLGFLDTKPLSLGNSLLIPKKHYRWVYDVPEFGQYWEAAKNIALATMPVVNASSVSFLTLGFEVPHAHIRIIPRFTNDPHTEGINTKIVIPQTPEELSNIASQILFNTQK